MPTAEKLSNRKRIKEILTIIKDEYDDSIIKAPQDLLLELRELCNHETNGTDDKRRRLIKQAREMLLQGYPSEEVSSKLGRSQSWVREISRKLKKPPRFRFKLYSQVPDHTEEYYFLTKADFERWAKKNDLNARDVIHRKTTWKFDKCTWHWHEIPVGSTIVFQKGSNSFKKSSNDYQEFKKYFES